MQAGSCQVSDAPPAAPTAADLVPPPPPEPCTPAELRALVHGGENDSDLCEKVLARTARIEAAFELEIGDDELDPALVAQLAQQVSTSAPGGRRSRRPSLSAAAARRAARGGAPVSIRAWDRARRIAGIVRKRLVGARVVAPSSDPLAVATITSYHVVMKSVGVADLKAHLSGHLRTVKRGETLLVLERGTPVARIVPAADLHAGIVTRPPTRDLASAKQMLKRLPPVPLPVDSLSVLLEGRHR